MERLKNELNSRQQKLDSQREAILREASEKAHAILKEAKDYADQTMRDFQKFGKAGISVKEMEKRRSELRGKMSKAAEKLAMKTPEKKAGTLKPSDLHIGDSVKVLSMNLKGTVSTKPDSKGYLFVQMGIIRSKVHLSDLQLIDEPVITGGGLSRTSSGKIRMSKSAFCQHGDQSPGKGRWTRPWRNWTNTWTMLIWPIFPVCGSYTGKAPAPCAREFTAICDARRSCRIFTWQSSERAMPASPL